MEMIHLFDFSGLRAGALFVLSQSIPGRLRSISTPGFHPQVAWKAPGPKRWEGWAGHAQTWMICAGRAAAWWFG